MEEGEADEEGKNCWKTDGNMQVSQRMQSLS